TIAIRPVRHQLDDELDTILVFIWGHLQSNALVTCVIRDPGKLRLGRVQDWNAPIGCHPDGVSNTVVHLYANSNIQCGRGNLRFERFHYRIPASNRAGGSSWLFLLGRRPVTLVPSTIRRFGCRTLSWEFPATLTTGAFGWSLPA